MAKATSESRKNDALQQAADERINVQPALTAQTQRKAAEAEVARIQSALSHHQQQAVEARARADVEVQGLRDHRDAIAAALVLGEVKDADLEAANAILERALTDRQAAAVLVQQAEHASAGLQRRMGSARAALAQAIDVENAALLAVITERQRQARDKYRLACDGLFWAMVDLQATQYLLDADDARTRRGATDDVLNLDTVVVPFTRLCDDASGPEYTVGNRHGINSIVDTLKVRHEASAVSDRLCTELTAQGLEMVATARWDQ